MAVRKIDLMHQLFGAADGKCGECDHLVEGENAKTIVPAEGGAENADTAD